MSETTPPISPSPPATEGRWELTPPVLDEQLRGVPASRGVIALLAEDGVPITVLTAASMRARLRTRLSEPPDELSEATYRKHDLRDIVRAVRWVRCESHFETDWKYLEWVSHYWPARLSELVSWKPPWYVHLDLRAEFPHPQKTRNAPSKSDAMCLGPFARRTHADRFIESLQDAFDLCRSLRCLRQSPNGAKCAYAEMGRCVSVSDGAISMAEYRHVLRRAWAYAAGDREDHRQQLTQQMAGAAESLQFEQASSVKTRLDRLAEFEHADYAPVGTSASANFLLVQAGRGVHELRCFAYQNGQLTALPPMRYPLADGACAALLAEWNDLPETTGDDASPLRLGLVVRCALAGVKRGGLVLRKSADITTKQLAEKIESATDALGVRAKPARTKPTTPALES